MPDPLYNPNANFQATGQTAPISSATLAPQQQIQVPPAPAVNPQYQSVIEGGNAILKSISDLRAKQEADALAQQQTSNPNDLTSLFQQYLGGQSQQPSFESAYASTQNDPTLLARQGTANTDAAALNDAQDQFDAINAQLAGVTAETQAMATYDPAKDPANAGRGITTGGIRPLQMQQAEALRQQAIKALPLQAQAIAAQAKVASAQRKYGLSEQLLSQAQTRIDKLFELHMTDSTNQYNYQKDLRDKVYEFATAQEKTRIEALQKKADQEHADQQDALKSAKELSKLAMDSGQSDIASKLWALDPKSKTYAADVATLQAQITQNPLDVALKQAQINAANRSNRPTDGGAPTVKSINGVDMQWNGKAWEPISAGAPQAGKNAADQLAFLRDTAAKAIELSTASGASGISKKIGDYLVGDTKFRRLEAQTNTLRTNVLTLMTDPGVKKYFGPQMSEADVRLMTAAGTTLNPENQSPQDLKTELSRLDNLFERMQTAVNNGARVEGSGGKLITAPDGTVVEIVD